jgi:hypothetical protein
VVAGESGEVGNPGTLGMTKERATFLWRVVAEPKAFFIILGGPQAHDSSGRDDNPVWERWVPFPSRLSSRPERTRISCHEAMDMPRVRLSLKKGA